MNERGGPLLHGWLPPFTSGEEDPITTGESERAKLSVDCGRMNCTLHITVSIATPTNGKTHLP
jgi:hypothetical protein